MVGPFYFQPVRFCLLFVFGRPPKIDLTPLWREFTQPVPTALQTQDFPGVAQHEHTAHIDIHTRLNLFRLALPLSGTKYSEFEWGCFFNGISEKVDDLLLTRLRTASISYVSVPPPAQDRAHAGRPSAFAAGAHLADSCQPRGDHRCAVPGSEGDQVAAQQC